MLVQQYNNNLLLKYYKVNCILLQKNFFTNKTVSFIKMCAINNVLMITIFHYFNI